MSDVKEDMNPSTFTSLVLSLSSTAWIGLGKIADPISGKIKIDLNGAKYSIDTLIMLREKTKGNLSDEESKLLNSVIADLQANYAETVFSSKEEKSEEKEKKENLKEKKNKEIDQEGKKDNEDKKKEGEKAEKNKES